MLPIFLYQLKNTLKISENAFKAIKMIIIILAWLFPYAVASIPFLRYFHPSRTQWLKDNGFKGIDWNENIQTGLYYTLLGILALFALVLAIL